MFVVDENEVVVSRSALATLAQGTSLYWLRSTEPSF
jgi:hypothetical protein